MDSPVAHTFPEGGMSRVFQSSFSLVTRKSGLLWQTYHTERNMGASL